MEDQRRVIGKLGEDLAAKHIANAGLMILERNWRHGRKGELDIIAADLQAGCYVVIEVRTRIGSRCGSAFASITTDKYARLRSLACAWLATQPTRARLRIDCVAIDVDRALYDDLASGHSMREAFAHHAYLRWEKAVFA